MNPYEKFIKCEDSGREIPNFKHKIWEEGARFVVGFIESHKEITDRWYSLEGCERIRMSPSIVIFNLEKWHKFLLEIGIEDNPS
ncbi:MAG: hypothetical protein KAS32_05095 [Candidatus Peribacteraceae bacterium]|nr:hypothetical protein [Candidatus Peribacteraceae bacterium]